MEALGIWMVLLAGLRLTSVLFGFFEADTMRIAFYSPMTDVHARTFGTWNMLSCTLLFMSGLHLQNKPLYTLTTISLVAAIAHYVTEHLIYQTIPLCALITPLLFSGLTLAWMVMEWDTPALRRKVRRQPRPLKTRVLSKQT